MSALLRWLLGLQQIRPEGWTGLGLSFERGGWLIWLPPLLLGVALLVTWCYRREPIAERPRALLATLRILVIVWLALLLARPATVFRQVHVEPSTTALLVDSSASMAERDDASGQSRLAAFSTLWKSRASSGVLKSSPERQWRIYSFDDELRPVASGGEPAPADALAALKAVGRRTDLGGALRKLLSSPDADRLTSVVVASDGGNNVRADWQEILSLARRNGTAIHAVRVGPDQPTAKLAVGPVWAPAKVFTFDPAEVRTSISAAHLGAKQAVAVEVYDPARQLVLAGKTVSPSPQSAGGPRETAGEIATADVQLTLQPLPAGVHRLQVRARTLANPLIVAQPETFEIEAAEHRLRVLYVEGYPRFEYRYLKNLLARERSLESSCLLLSADTDFVQEGTTPIGSFPTRPEDLYAFDVVILGDVDPGGAWWTASQQQLLESFVERRGGGLVLLTGRRWMPSAISPGSALERLLPVELAPAAGGMPSPEPFVPTLTAAGRAAPMLAFQQEVADPAGWLNEAPGLYWSAAIGEPKRGSEALLERPGVAGGQAAPLVVLGRYGAGRILLHGSDDTWRWRKEVGDRYHDGYWLGVLRYLARSKLLGQDRRVLLQADRQQYAGGEPVQLKLTALDPTLAAEWPEGIAVTATDGHGETVGRFELTSLAAVGRGQAPSSEVSAGASTSRNGASPQAQRSGSWTPPGLGRFVFSIEPAALGEAGVSVRESVQVAADAEESRDTSPDPILLHRLAAGSGGVSLRLEDLAQLPALLKDRPKRTVDEAAASLWDTPLALIVLVGLLATEWVSRKRLGLV